MYSYLKIAFRNIRRQKFYAFINIAGLTIGLVSSLLIILYIVDEFSYDRFHKDAGRISRINLMGRMSGHEFNSPLTSAPVASGFLNEISGVEQACRIALWEDKPLKHEEDLFIEKTVLVADSNFFSFFSFKLLSGDPVNVLARPNSIVLTETAASRIFGYTGSGDNRCIGQSLEIGNEKRVCNITGICEDPPQNSTFHAKFRKEQQLGRIFLVFTFLAIAIASFGLLGLSSFTSEQRSKEIGIRKAMGSSSAGIIKLLSMETLNLIFISIFIAALFSSVIINWWLNNFAYKTNISVLPFVAGGIISVLIAIISVGYQSLKAASRNPVDSLKYE